jgi:hypothetical protein
MILVNLSVWVITMVPLLVVVDKDVHKLLGVAKFSSLSCYVLQDETQSQSFL